VFILNSQVAKYKLEITEFAEIEFSNGFNYYESQQIGLGNHFELEADVLLSKISDNPFLFQRKFKHFREAVFRKFPYFIVYEINGNLIIIHSFFHTRRIPKSKLNK
jgi:toxin ParE1/3/4